ncbi:MAG: hypothetical protein P8X88_01425 [Gammaproteobacteria bacterium]
MSVGLYIARLIAEFDQGHITIENNWDKSGVVVSTWLLLVTRK